MRTKPCLLLFFLATTPSSSLRLRGTSHDDVRSSEVCVRQWYQDLGNHLIILENAVAAATAQNISAVRLVTDHTLQQVLDVPGGEVALTNTLTSRLDSSGKACDVDVSGAAGFFRERHMKHHDLRGLLQAHVVKYRRRCPEPSAQARRAVGQSGIVMHMRSGDIMKHPALNGFYAQPPCAYYRDVVDRGNAGKQFEHVLIVTQADRGNPCVDELVRAFPDRVTVQSGSVGEDSCAILSAQNLALSYGTFSLTLSRLNTAPLRNLYIPFGEDNSTIYPHHALRSDTSIWWRQLLDDKNMPYTQHIYTFPGFQTKVQDWTDMLDKMTTYPVASLIRRTEKAAQ